MNYMEINKKIEQLKNSGLYNDEQIEAIKYACFRNDFNEDLIINPAIQSDIMLTYLKLATNRKINVSKYINENWHLKGFNSEQLYELICCDSKGFDIEGITPNMDNEEIKRFINNKINNTIKTETSENIGTLPAQQIDILKSLDISSFEFLVRQYNAGYDISALLRPNINEFSFEQIKYLFTIYSIGNSIEKIYNPKLSVDQMKEIISVSTESLEFLQSIVEQKNTRKK